MTPPIRSHILAGLGAARSLLFEVKWKLIPAPFRLDLSAELTDFVESLAVCSRTLDGEALLLRPIHFATLASPSLDTCQMTKR